MAAILHILSPVVVTVAYLAASLNHVFESKKSTLAQKNNGSGRSLPMACLALTALVMVSYVCESILLAHVLPSHAATSSNHNLVFTLFSSLVWLILFLRIIDSSASHIRRIFSLAWIFALAFDLTLLISDTLTPKLSGAARTGRLFLQAIRFMLLLALVGIALGKRLTRHAKRVSDEEIAPLLARIESHLSASGFHHANGDAYGTTTGDDSLRKADANVSSQPEAEDVYEDSDDEEAANAERGKFKKDWWVYTKAFAIFLPHLWPRKNLRLQLHFPALGLCVLACRALNVLVPIQLGIIINVLRKTESSIPWAAIGLFTFLRFLDSSAGISLVQSWLWLPINRYTTQELNCAAYDQIMNLSSDFHDSKKSGRVWRIVSRGESLTDLVHTIGFEMIPMAADLAIAVSVFWWLFGAYMAFIVALTSTLFLWATARTIPMRTKQQRKFIKAWEDEYSQMTESSLNWTTVCHFNRIGYEQNRYKGAVRQTQNELIRYRALSFVTSGLRALTLRIGLLVATMLAAYQICQGHRNVGDFVILITYWAQLSGPLSFFASGFSKIAVSLVDAEKLLELLQTKPSVDNHEGATDLILKQGQIDFDRISFSYDGKRQVLNNISLRAEPGQTIALVGETGGGKSTILKLLFRFYDATGGNIMIDGQDIRLVTLESLRANIGCVPQDPVLFNQTILENLRYANLDATEEQVWAACKAVAVHEKIMSFTKGYYEKVGERGVKLSGGELQRLAIARAILKDPKILLLDEATSSVDSETEAVIQSSLKKLCAGRTTFVVAHRLSTIVHADLVMVIKNGSIVERGTHERLSRLGGHYSKLWKKQLQLHTGEEGSRSRSHSPEKTAAFGNDMGSRAGLPTKTPVKRSSQMDSTASGQAGDRKGMEPIMDAKVRGRSPRRDDSTWEKFDSMRRRILGAKPPRRRGENTCQERRSQSYSPTRPSLKPDAPEFVPTQSLQNGISYLGQPTDNSRRSGLPSRPQSHADSSCQTAAEVDLLYASEAQKENLLSTSNPSMSQSTSALSVLSEGKNTRFGFHLPNGQRRQKTGNANSWAEFSTSEGGPEQGVFQSGQTKGRRQDKRSRFGKQMFNSRRNISKSEPQGQNERGRSNEQDGLEPAIHPSVRQSDQDNMSRRRSSAPNEANLSGEVGHQGIRCSQPGSEQEAIGPDAGESCNWRASGAVSSESTVVEDENINGVLLDNPVIDSKDGVGS